MVWYIFKCMFYRICKLQSFLSLDNPAPYFSAMHLSKKQLQSFGLLFLLAVHGAHAMFNKRAMPDTASLPPRERLRANIEDLFLSGDIPGHSFVS